MEEIYDCRETRGFQTGFFHGYPCGYISFSHLVPVFLLQASVCLFLLVLLLKAP